MNCVFIYVLKGWPRCVFARKPFDLNFLQFAQTLIRREYRARIR